MATPPSNHRPPSVACNDPALPPSAELAEAVRIGVAELVAVLTRVFDAGVGNGANVDFVRASDAERLPAPESDPTPCTVPVVGVVCCRDGGPAEVAETLGWLVATGTDEASLRPWAEWMAPWIALAATVERLRAMAFADELTAAGNRRAFELFLPQAIAEARERGRPLVLMVFDIDDFKRYNDQFGHEAGDAVLVETVALLSAVIRRGDRVFRIGGDEFVVVFADPEGQRGGGSGAAHIESVDQIVDRFRRRVSELRLPQLGHAGPGTVTISAGLATYPWDGDEAQALLSHADRLALESKRRGKNVITFGPRKQPQPDRQPDSR